MKDKIQNEYLRRTRKLLETKLLPKPYQRNKYLGCTPRKMFQVISEVGQRKTLANGPKNKKTYEHA